MDSTQLTVANFRGRPTSEEKKMSTAVIEMKETTSPYRTNPQEQTSSVAPSAPPEAVLTQMITESLGSQAE